MRTNPWSWYSSPEILRLELERIFRPAWHYAGPLAWAAGRGDRFPCLAGDVPVVVVRDGEGALRAFVNVCRHRGSEIVSERGNGHTLQCPYHAWTYGLDGSLRAAPRSEREAAFDPAELGLRPALVDTWGPFAFVSVELEVPPLTAVLGRLPALVETDGLVFRERVEYALAANWKIAVENFLECYHCPVAHQGFSAVVDVDPDAYRLEEEDGVWSQFGERRGDGAGASTCQFHLVWPALKLNVFPGVANLSIGPVRPTGPDRSTGFLDYYFAADASDDDVRALFELDDQVGREDAALVESVQRGVASGVVERGALLPESERLVRGFQTRVAGVLSETL